MWVFRKRLCLGSAEDLTTDIRWSDLVFEWVGLDRTGVIMKGWLGEDRFVALESEALVNGLLLTRTRNGFALRPPALAPFRSET